MIVSRAPVRLSMGGGGTDFPSYYTRYGGFLMAASINKYVYININRRFNEAIRLSYSRTEIVDDIDHIQHNIFREALRLSGVSKQIEIVSIADVPANCGLGTSSAFTVALLNGLYTYIKKTQSTSQLAEAACHLELDVLSQPIGRQDQYASAFGGFNSYSFNTDGSIEVRPVAIKQENLLELQNNIFLFYLNKERSASSILAAQDDRIKQGSADTIAMLHKIKDLGLRTQRVFEKGDMDEFGEILNEHWTIKKGLSDKITDPFIDEAYALARKTGALGGKVVGAGGGGFLLLYCPDHKTELVSAMRSLGLAPMWFAFEPEGAKILFNH